MWFPGDLTREKDRVGITWGGFLPVDLRWTVTFLPWFLGRAVSSSTSSHCEALGIPDGAPRLTLRDRMPWVADILIRDNAQRPCWVEGDPSPGRWVSGVPSGKPRCPSRSGSGSTDLPPPHVQVACQDCRALMSDRLLCDDENILCVAQYISNVWLSSSSNVCHWGTVV